MAEVSSSSSTRTFPSLLLANVQSLLNKAEDLKTRLEDKQIDVCAITDAKIKDAALSQISGYNMWMMHTNDQKKRSDVALYVRDNITSTILPVHVPSGLDVLWVRADPRGLPPDVSCLVYCVLHYTQPHTSTLREDLITHIIDVVTGIYSREPDTGIIILGVFRDFPEHKLPPDLNLQQVINRPGHNDKNMDIIVTNLIPHYKKPKLVRPIASSKHKSVYWAPK